MQTQRLSGSTTPTRFNSKGMLLERAHDGAFAVYSVLCAVPFAQKVVDVGFARCSDNYSAVSESDRHALAGRQADRFLNARSDGREVLGVKDTVTTRPYKVAVAHDVTPLIGGWLSICRKSHSVLTEERDHLILDTF